MPKSILTAKYQTTVPKEVREKLGARPGDVLQWEVVGDQVRVTAASPAFLSLQGHFKVGPGGPVEDVRKARELTWLRVSEREIGTVLRTEKDPLALEEEHNRLAGLLADFEQEKGPIEPEVMEEIRRAWPAPSERPD